KQHLHVAVFPVDNPSSAHAPLEEIRQSLIRRLKTQGADVLDDAALEQFMAKHRVRYIAGLDTATSKSLSSEVGVNAVLITSVDTYNEAYPPQIALISRLVSTGPTPSVLWADSVGMTGSDHPGLLGLGLIADPRILQHKAVGKLGDLLTGYLAGEKARIAGGRKSFGPKASYRSPVVGTDLRLNAVGFVDNSSSGDEGKGPARLAVALTSESGVPVTVKYAVTGGTAEEGKSYVVKGDTLTFKPGETLKSIEIDIRHDGVNTGDRTVEVSLKNPTGAVLGGSAVHTFTIIDSDPEPAVTLAVPSQQVKKNAGTAAIGVELSAVSGRDVIVPFMVGGTAKTPENYTITPSPVVIKAGERGAAITVQIADNGVNGDDKTVVVSMGVPTHAVQGKTTTSTMTIVSTNPQPAISSTIASQQEKENAGKATITEPAVSFTSGGSSGEEKSGPARIEVKLSAASGRPVTVEYAVSGGTAIQGKDYALQAGPLTFAPGETAKEIMLDIKDNDIYDDSKTLEVSLKNPKNAVLGSSTVHTYTIINNHPKPTVAVLSANERLRKSAGRASVTVQLSGVSGKDVIVPFTVSGSADQGRDFDITPSPVVIKAGTRSAEIAITMKDNVLVEADKTIEVKLLNPDNAFLGPGLYRLVMVKDANPTIAVTPFFNGSTKKNAGNIMMFQFVKELKKLGDFTVVEPGVVRQQFLTMRIVMSEGVSSSDVNLIASNINADLILTGKVMAYQDDIAQYGQPQVAFSVMLIDRSSKKIIWSSRSYNKATDAVILFDWGSVNSANEMVSEMVRVLIRRVLTW
ncbi:MAG TPA: Calx-beta domain-containing protein, partial [Nitrospirota bacterium]|nr:Calx-beta domain-containing protein [Nitrospirota bacterium]